MKQMSWTKQSGKARGKAKAKAVLESLPREARKAVLDSLKKLSK